MRSDQTLSHRERCEHLFKDLRGSKRFYQPVPTLAEGAAKVRVFENRMEFIQSNILHIPVGRVLDIGSCFGWNSFWLAERGFTVVGVERGKVKVDVCECIRVMGGLSADNPTFHQMMVEEYASVYDEAFDLMLNLNTFHHMIKKDERRAWETLDCLSRRCGSMVLQCGRSGIHRQVVERTSYENSRNLGKAPGTRGVIARHLVLYW